MAVTETFTRAVDGVPIGTYTWLPENKPRALVQIAHGAAEHALRQDRFARHLAARGYPVVASDHRGRRDEVHADLLPWLDRQV